MKTDNSYLAQKVQIRMESLPEKDMIMVLDCYSGRGIIWNEVANQTTKKIKVLSIEKEPGKNNKALNGSNLKYLNVINLDKFDVIDLDSYGIPFKQIEIILKKGFKGIVHVTAIQSGMGKLPNDMLKSIGYTSTMIERIPSIFNRKGIDKLKNYLYLNGIQQITGYFIDRKNYFYINTKNNENLRTSG